MKVKNTLPTKFISLGIHSDFKNPKYKSGFFSVNYSGSIIIRNDGLILRYGHKLEKD